jgi:hypothetical protein
MLKNRFRIYIFVQALVVVGVLFCFRVIPDKKWASVVASNLFLWSSMGVLYAEAWVFKTDRKPLVLLGTGIFIVLFIVPVMVMRLSHWDLDFNEIAIAGISGKSMHQFSNYGFMLMLVTYFIESFRENKKGLE